MSRDVLGQLWAHREFREGWALGADAVLFRFQDETGAAFDLAISIPLWRELAALPAIAAFYDVQLVARSSDGAEEFGGHQSGQCIRPRSHLFVRFTGDGIHREVKGDATGVTYIVRSQADEDDAARGDSGSHRHEVNHVVRHGPTVSSNCPTGNDKGESRSASIGGGL